MNSKEAAEILLKYKAGTATADEKAWVESWYVRFKDRASVVPGDQIAADQAESWAVFEKEYAAVISSRADKTKVTRLWPRVAVAAAAVAAIVVGVWFLFAPRHPDAGQDPGSAQYANDIAPGRNTATLTLASGKVIELDTNNTSVVVADSIRTMTMLTAATPRGGTYQVVLPDGTRVWLNADSKISFPSQFAGKHRKILLEGEAYFEVAKDKVHPFIVESGAQMVEVLGTHFNINSYADEVVIKTTLLEGSVRVSSAPLSAATRDLSSGKDVFDKQDNETVILKPGQQSVYVKNTLQVKQADPELETAWKNGMFRFEGTELKTIMQQLGRWYNLDVSYEGAIPQRTFNGVINRNVNLSEILKVLEAGDVRFKILPALEAGGAKRIIVLQ